MDIMLLAAGNNMAPFIGIGLVVLFVVIIILATMADKKNNKKFNAMIESDYKAKDKSGRVAVTENKQILVDCPSGTLVGYKLYNFEDVKYFGFKTIPPSESCFYFAGDDLKPMKGQYLTPSKKPLMQKGQISFPSKKSEMDQVYEFLVDCGIDSVGAFEACVIRQHKFLSIEAAGISFPDLCTMLIEYALE